MEIINVKIRDNITIVDRIDAIEFIANSYFTNGRYTPYYVEISKYIAVAKFFLEGVSFSEDDDIFGIACSNEKIKPLVDKFFVPSVSKTNAKYLNIMDDVMKHVEDIVDFRKQTIIHSSTVDEERIIQKLDQILEKEMRNKDAELKVLNETEKLQKSQLQQAKYANKVAEYMTPEEMAQMNKMLMEKKFDPNELARIVADKYLQSEQHNRNVEDIISDKNAKIQELQKYKQMHDARNVLADDKK